MSSTTPQQQKKTRSNRRGRGRNGKKKAVQQNRPKKVVRQQQSRRPRQRRGAGMAGIMSSRTASGIGATSFKSGRARTITVQNEEFIGAVTVANQPSFNVVSYAINPGQSSTFPWLSLMAPQWEKYTFNMLEFYFKREVSEFATAGAAGKVILSADFDASDAPPTTKQQMEDSVPHADGMPCENITIRLPKNQMHLNSLAKYVRRGGLPGGADIKTYDVANLHVATQGIPANSEVGELRVRYSCTFSVPVLDSTTAIPANNSIAYFQTLTSGAGESLATTVPYQVLFATATANGIQAVNTAGSIVLPAGKYLVDVALNIRSAGGDVTSYVISIQKNAADYIQDFLNSTDFQALQWTQPLYYTSNGTDALTVLVNCIFAGTCVVWGTMRIESI